MEVQVIETWDKAGVRYYKLMLPGALNKPILKVPLKLPPIEHTIQVATGARCEIYPNHNVRKDGTCVRSSMCVAYRKACKAK